MIATTIWSSLVLAMLAVPITLVIAHFVYGRQIDRLADALEARDETIANLQNDIRNGESEANALRIALRQLTNTHNHLMAEYHGAYNAVNQDGERL